MFAHDANIHALHIFNLGPQGVFFSMKPLLLRVKQSSQNKCLNINTHHTENRCDYNPAPFHPGTRPVTNHIFNGIVNIISAYNPSTEEQSFVRQQARPTSVLTGQLEMCQFLEVKCMLLKASD